MSYLSLTYHIVFGTYMRKQVIGFEHERELYKYIYEFATKQGAKVWRIGGMPDHVHILCDIPAKCAVADFVRVMKSESSKFLSVNSHFPAWEKWAAGYACVSVDAASKQTRINYIMNQKEHHRKKSFAEEWKEFLSEYGFSDDALK